MALYLSLVVCRERGDADTSIMVVSSPTLLAGVKHRIHRSLQLVSRIYLVDTNCEKPLQSSASYISFNHFPIFKLLKPFPTAFKVLCGFLRGLRNLTFLIMVEK